MNGAAVSQSRQGHEDTCSKSKRNKILDVEKNLDQNKEIVAKQETQNGSSKILENKFDLPSFKCEVCPYESIWKHSVKRHQQTHYKGQTVPEGKKKQKYQCETCSYSTNNWTILKDHQKHHNLPKTKIKPIYNLNQTEQTIKQAEENKYACKNCKYETTQKLVFKNHMKVHFPKNEVEIFQCDQCSFYSVYKQSFLRHIKAIHENHVTKKCDYVNGLHCSYCGITSDTKHHFEQHMKTHTEQEIPDEQSAHNNKIIPLVKDEGNSAGDVQSQNNNLICTNLEEEIKSPHIINTSDKIEIQKATRGTRRGKYSDVPVKTTKNGLFECEHCSYQTAIRTALVKHQTNHLKNSNS